MKTLRSSPGARALVCQYLAVFLVMLLLTGLTPMIADDYSYCFSWADNARITSPLQIPASVQVQRQLTNGRVVAHALVQLILLAPKALFNLLNACSAVLLLWLFGGYFRERSDWQRVLLTLIGSLLLFNCTPAFGQVALWLDGSVNYSWSVVLFLLFLRPYAASWLGREEKRSLPQTLGFLLSALLAGAYSENGSLATLFAAFCLSLLTALRDRKLSWRLPAGLTLGLAGYLFLMTAPATAGRAAGASSLARNLKYLVALTRTELLPLFLLFAMALALCLLLRVDRKRLVLAAVLFLAGLGSLTSFVFARYFVPRHFCFTVYFTVLACLILFSALLEKGRPVLPALTAAVMAVLFAFNLAQGGLDVYVIHAHYQQREDTIRTALAQGQRDLQVLLYEPSTRYSAAQGLEDLNTVDSEAWPNCRVADYYGLDSILGVAPESDKAPES